MAKKTTRRNVDTTSPKARRLKGIVEGYRSGLEEEVAKELEQKNIGYEYEKLKIEWVDHKIRTYTPDFVLENGIIVETKGRFVPADRRKHLEIKKQQPHLDIRFVFTNPNAKLYKGAKSSYADWCKRHGFKFAAVSIPDEWLKEPKRSATPTQVEKEPSYLWCLHSPW